MSVREEAAKLAGDIADLRHAIHAEPEIGLDLPKTQAKVLDALAGLPLDISTGQALSSVTAVLRGGRHIATGCVAGPSETKPPAEAEQALANYIARKYQPERRRQLAVAESNSHPTAPQRCHPPRRFANSSN